LLPGRDADAGFEQRNVQTRQNLAAAHRLVLAGIIQSENLELVAPPEPDFGRFGRVFVPLFSLLSN
jgi:hypothetical protein